MVNMVNDQMIRSGHYHPVHLEAFAPGASGGVKSVAVGVDEPFIFNQPVVIVCIDDGEFSLCKGYRPGYRQAELEISGRVEIRAGLVQLKNMPFADPACPLHAYQGRAVGADGPGRKNTVIATDMIRIAYVVMRIAYHRILKNS